MSDAPTLTRTLLNGVRLNCPSCGAGGIFASYLKRRDACPHCGESFVGLDADDGPAWLTIGIAARRSFGPPDRRRRRIPLDAQCVVEHHAEARH